MEMDGTEFDRWDARMERAVNCLLLGIGVLDRAELLTLSGVSGATGVRGGGSVAQFIISAMLGRFI